MLAPGETSDDLELHVGAVVRVRELPDDVLVREAGPLIAGGTISLP
ncbi:MAG: hypothetical protein KC468_25930 [Myxococcales bacterium]|nr:hypothetical protein [Myxococcales bacterium]